MTRRIMITEGFAMNDLFHMEFTDAQVKQISSLGLAHIGDGVFELMTRAYLCSQGGKTVLNLHKQAISLVNAPAQAKFAQRILPELTEDEAGFYRRGKNAHTHAAPKAASPGEYARATGVEALFGALYLMGRTDRLNELYRIGMDDKEA